MANNFNLSIYEVKDDSIKLLNDIYMDNRTTGGSMRDVDRIIEFKLDNKSFTDTILSIMRKVGLKLQTIETSHSVD